MSKVFEAALENLNKEDKIIKLNKEILFTVAEIKDLVKSGLRVDGIIIPQRESKLRKLIALRKEIILK